MPKLRRRTIPDVVHHNGDMPALLRWEWVYRAGGEIIIAEYLWLLAGAWAKRPEASEPNWTSKRIGPFILASQLHR